MLLSLKGGGDNLIKLFSLGLDVFCLLVGLVISLASNQL